MNKFCRGQRVLIGNATPSGGIPNRMGVIYSQKSVERGGSNSYTVLVLIGDSIPDMIYWYYENELTLYCSDTKKGEKIIGEY